MKQPTGDIKLSKKQKKEFKKLTYKEKVIYLSVMSSFPATAHDCALNVAYQGGVHWQFVHT